MPMTDSPERFCSLEQVAVGDDGSEATVMDVEGVRIVQNSVILKLKDIDTALLAQPLRGRYVFVRREEIRPLPPGRYYIFQIIGLDVVKEDGSPVGRIIDVVTLPANDVYVVDGVAGEILIPATREIVKTIDIDKGVMIIRPLEGLFDS